MDLDQLARHAAFGGICGSITGFTCGLVDAANIVRRDKLPLESASRLAFEEMARSGIILASFFAGYQTVKYTLRNSEEKVFFSMFTMIPLSLPTLRRYIPFALTLVAVDAYHSYNK